MSSHVLTYIDWKRIQESEEMYSAFPLNEEFSVSETLHLIGDVVSAASDCIWPGSGAVVDIVQAITYFLESSLAKDYIERVSSAIGGIVSLASLALVGPMQALAIEAKGLLKVVKDGIKKGASEAQIAAGKTASTKLVKFLQGIVSSASSIASKIVDLVKNAAESKLGSWIISKFGTMEKFVAWINKFFKQTLIGFLNKFIGTLGKLNPAAAAGSIDDVTIGKFGKEYTSSTAQDSIGNDLLSKGRNEINSSGIPTSLKYVARKYGSEDQQFQRDTSNDLRQNFIDPKIKRRA